MNYGQGSQQSSAKSGLRGTQYQQTAETGAASSANTLAQTAGEANADLTKYKGQSGSQLLPTGKYGTASNMDPAVESMLGYSFNKASGSAGIRGQQSPENLGAIAGSSVTNALPSLMPYIQQWQLEQFNAPVKLNQAAVQNAQAPAANWAALLGAQSNAQGSNFNFGLNSASTSGGGGANQSPPAMPSGGF